MKLTTQEQCILEVLISFRFTIREKIELLYSYKKFMDPAVFDYFFDMIIFTADFKRFMENRRKN